ncbi:Maltooligosyl trehalose synthase [Chlamydiales bacterium STE3]|nr:Maltooligosyl trehalose synthase [Chlamydiales bacterium STE3]
MYCSKKLVKNMKKKWPRATYRLQFNKNFTFKHALTLLDYFQKLGISHLYASPLLRAKEGSMHGYDFVDPSQINPDIGTKEELRLLAEKLQAHGMSLIADIVPNHMYIGQSSNKWWLDVLEKGRDSPFADYFDITWDSAKPSNHHKVLIPALDRPYGQALENQIIQILFQDGSFVISLYGYTLPTNSKSWKQILSPLLEQQPSHELRHLLHDLESLEVAVFKKKLTHLLLTNPSLNAALEQQLKILNGTKGDTQSFDALDAFLKAQFYRLAFWQVANEELNFRRFFDIVEYAGIRPEKMEVYKDIHQLIFECVEKGWITGLRIDHIDGLRDPKKYLSQLDASLKYSTYLITEKILTGKESIRSDWTIDGTVGYDTLNFINGVFVYQPNKEQIWSIYHQFTGTSTNVSDLYYTCKKHILETSLASELHRLACHLEKIASSQRSSQDYTFKILKQALGDIIACFPVYRSYIRATANEIDEEDRLGVKTAVQEAVKRQTGNQGVYHFIENLLLLSPNEDLPEEGFQERADFVMRFQQITGPVMAKGVEDTAFYRFYPLASLNEVGNELHQFGISTAEFHQINQRKSQLWPHAMSASTTHDTKRGEDVRARINFLSEMADEWGEKLAKWHGMNIGLKKQSHGALAPDNNEEYLLYQTLIGSWPIDEMDGEAFEHYKKRIKDYMTKALREAKIHTSWLAPCLDYEESVASFIDEILNPHHGFLEDFANFTKPLISLGLLNSLAQTLLKLTSPGIPDIYQGNEVWDFSLVDPDNRRPIDFFLRKKLLEEAQTIEKVLENPKTGMIKLFLIQKVLEFRKKHEALFNDGSYQPVSVIGPMKNHLVAFIRELGDEAIIVITGRFFSFYRNHFHEKSQEGVWEKTTLVLPEKFANVSFTDVLSEKAYTALELHKLFSKLPLALVEIKRLPSEA